MNNLSILIKKIEQSLRLNPRNAILLDTGLMILVIVYGIMKITKSLGVEMYLFNENVMYKDRLHGKKEERKT